MGREGAIETCILEGAIEGAIQTCILWEGA